MAVAVVISFSEVGQAAQPAVDSAEVLAFGETEVARALDVIVQRRPPLVMVDQVFATTSPGEALIHRIKDDSALQSCEIRIVAFGESPTGPLDMSGTRRAPRFTMARTINVDLDGKPATLVNMSLVGAQVLSATIVKPQQRLRCTLTDEGRPIRIQCLVASVAVEILKGTPRYRAGVEFLNADQAVLQKFINKNKK